MLKTKRANRDTEIFQRIELREKDFKTAILILK